MTTPDYSKIQMIMALRQQNLRDRRLLDAIERTPREVFVAANVGVEVYADQDLPIGCGQVMPRPFIVAFMVNRLAPTDRSKVLEVGTGSGYQAAILSRLCRRVYTVERHRSLLRGAEDRFARLQLRNITSMVGDGSKGWPAQAPFDRIIVNAAVRVVPGELLAQLAEGGTMVLPVEIATGGQELRAIHHTPQGFETERLTAAQFEPLVRGVAREG